MKRFAWGLSAVILSSNWKVSFSGMCSRKPRAEEAAFCPAGWNRWRPGCPEQLQLLPPALPAVLWLGTREAVPRGTSCEYVEPGDAASLTWLSGSNVFGRIC